MNQDVDLNGESLFFSQVHLNGGPASVRQYLLELIGLIWQRKIDPGKVFDLTLPLDQAAEAYQAMDERRAIKAPLTPCPLRRFHESGDCTDLRPVRTGRDSHGRR
jgi:threonine dehydrogenase-like Zn-dependent dehydrogenase